MAKPATSKTSKTSKNTAKKSVNTASATKAAKKQKFVVSTTITVQPSSDKPVAKKDVIAFVRAMLTEGYVEGGQVIKVTARTVDID